jgi:hypothetical protein
MTTVKQPVAQARRVQRSREDCVRSAVASLEMEGLTVSGDTEELFARWERGEITNEELIDAAVQMPATRVPDVRG